MFVRDPLLDVRIRVKKAALLVALNVVSVLGFAGWELAKLTRGIKARQKQRRIAAAADDDDS